MLTVRAPPLALAFDALARLRGPRHLCCDGASRLMPWRGRGRGRSASRRPVSRPTLAAAYRSPRARRSRIAVRGAGHSSRPLRLWVSRASPIRVGAARAEGAGEQSL